MRRDKLKLLTVVVLLSLFALAGCQYLKSDFSEGAFPLEKGTQWVYLVEESGDTVILEVGKKIAKKFSNQYSGLFYNCENKEFEKMKGQIVGRKIKVIKGGDFYFNFVVKNGDCYNFYYSDKVGNYLKIYGNFGLNSKVDTVWAESIEVPYPIIIHYKPNVGFTEIESLQDFKLIEYKKP